MRKKVCISKSIAVITLIVVITVISIIFSSSLLKTQTSYQSKAAPPKIIDGFEVNDPKRFPFAARFFTTTMSKIEKAGGVDKVDIMQSGFCIGTLVAPQWILTAGHCAEIIHSGVGWNRHLKVYIFIGSNDLTLQDRKKHIYEVDINMIKDDLYKDSLVKHKKDTAAYFDLALLKLVEPVDPSIALPVKIADSNSTSLEVEGTRAVILGWGKLAYNGEFPKILQMGVVPIVSNERVKQWRECKISNVGSELLRGYNMCVGYPLGGPDTCRGDSGGPLLVWTESQWVQIGINSEGWRCGYPHNPGINVRLSHIGRYTLNNKGRKIDFLKWIQDAITPSSSQQYFVGTDITAEEAAEYNSRVCNPNEWKTPEQCKDANQSVPTICSQQ